MSVHEATVRRKKTAKEGREQLLRSNTRFALKFAAGIIAVQSHHGNELPKSWRCIVDLVKRSEAKEHIKHKPEQPSKHAPQTFQRLPCKHTMPYTRRLSDSSQPTKKLRATDTPEPYVRRRRTPRSPTRSPPPQTFQRPLSKLSLKPYARRRRSPRRPTKSSSK